MKTSFAYDEGGQGNDKCKKKKEKKEKACRREIGLVNQNLVQRYESYMKNKVGES